MGIIKKQIEDIINGSKKSSLFSFGSFLLFVSVVYLFAVKTRIFLYKINFFRSRQLPCFVISVGNLTAGGAGKTPMTIKLVELIRSMGYKVAVLSRGYKGGLEKEGGIVCDGRKILVGPDMSGDEPFMMASALNVPVAVGQDRYKVGMKVVNEFSPDVIVLDDAFQHIKLKRDLDLLLMDYCRPTGNTHLLPRGPLREPVSSISRCDTIIFTRSDQAPDSEHEKSHERIIKVSGVRPFFMSSHEPYIYKIIKKTGSSDNEGKCHEDNFEFLKGKKVFLFSGISRNNDFKKTVETFNCEINGRLNFSDHHKYCDKEFDTISQLSIDANVDYIITTEKDYSRTSGFYRWPVDLVIIGIKISFDDNENEFLNYIRNKLGIVS
ncbi:MAG: tetraacyldisaccharide 4'-kinase [Desulfobacterales bacterium]|jgi:tetraacyldisaccharide 4'-kinase|nr:tetraacyldisaccharide 4'-kinase [Desulfobacteraceae bacterium]MBT4364414.1 tetraacyldisaccharide 4'-kinase [Desulfobacteraceae bacterium]MBT7085691.1 tetraacyldisaccharide 4'-kinase [Desulfobacterales bacterium]MBT7696226.1 tetraacyldisaccharide 4'-kinase [Desulfobacterales bacterium]